MVGKTKSEDTEALAVSSTDGFGIWIIRGIHETPRASVERAKDAGITRGMERGGSLPAEILARIKCRTMEVSYRANYE